jgi:hypothetical protein
VRTYKVDVTNRELVYKTANDVGVVAT